MILDISDPINPKQVGMWDVTYLHDIVIVPRDGKYIGFGAAIYENTKSESIYVIDVTDPTNPTTLSAFKAHWNWTHNAWPTVDGKYLYVTHEEVGAPITIWNTADLHNIFQVGELFVVANNKGAVAHNVHVRDNRLWISYYSQGSIVYDITVPDKPVLIGQYDTSPGIPFGMDGTWGQYPYSNTKNSYASDMSNGLFILKLNEAPAHIGPQGIQGDSYKVHFTAFIVISTLIQVALIVVVGVLWFKLRRAAHAYSKV